MYTIFVVGLSYLVTVLFRISNIEIFIYLEHLTYGNSNNDRL